MSRVGVAPTKPGSHECPAERCSRNVSDQYLACRIHWGHVSPATRSAVYAAYRSGDLRRHAQACRDAIDEMNHRARGGTPA